MIIVECDLCGKKAVNVKPQDYKHFQTNKAVKIGDNNDIDAQLFVRLLSVSDGGPPSFKHICRACGKKELKKLMDNL